MKRYIQTTSDSRPATSSAAKGCKRLLLLSALLCAVTTTVWADVTLVSNAEQLRTALLANKDIRLTADIDFTGVNWSPVTPTDHDAYTGTLDGMVDFSEGSPDVITYMVDEKGNPLKVKDENDEEVEVPYYMHRLLHLSETLICWLEGATLKNLIVEQSNFEATSITGGYYQNDRNGLLCLEAYQTTFMNIIFNDCMITDGNLLKDANHIGLVAGYAERSKLGAIGVTNCTIHADGSIVGSLVGEAVGTLFAACWTDFRTAVYGSDMLISRVGGICGLATSYYDDNDQETPCTFTDCTNAALVGTGEKADRLGGIVGDSEGSLFTHCENTGLVSHMDSDDWEHLRTQVSLYSTPFITFGTAASSWLFFTSYVYHTKLAEQASSSGISFIQGMMVYLNKSKELADAAAMLSNAKFFLFTTGCLIALEILWIIYDVQDPDEVGGICGNATGGSFDCCINRGYVRCLDAYCGGIVGYAEDVTIADCLNTGAIVGGEQTGGIVGALCGEGSVSCCVNTGTVRADEETVGPIYGELDDDATTTGPHFIIGPGLYPDLNLGNGFFLVNRQRLASGYVASTFAENGHTVWRQKVGEDFLPLPDESLPEVTAADGDNPIDDHVDCFTEVGSIEELRTALSNPYAWIRLTSDIALEDGDHSMMTKIYPFSGYIDGNGHSITGLQRYSDYTLEESDQTPRGLISYAEGAIFKNLTLSGVDLTGTIHVGALVGSSSGSTYEDIRLTDSPRIRCTGEECGGIVGTSAGDTFRRCVVESTIEDFSVDGFSTGEGRAGGIAGKAEYSDFYDCVNNATLIVNDNRAGGIVGEAFRCTFHGCVNNATVSHLYTSGMLAIDDELGGIVGYAKECTLDQCTNNGSCLGGDAYVGGIVGYATGTTMTNCIHAGIAQGDEQTGAIVGYFEEGRIRNSLVLGTVTLDEGDTPVTGFGMLFGDKGEDTGWSNNYIQHTAYDPGEGGRALVTSAQLASGAVAWWLNGSTSEGTLVWYQTIGVQATPQFSGDVVYYDANNGTYANTPPFAGYKPGDLNGDHAVDVSDITALVSVILGSTKAEDLKRSPDVNGDHTVDVSDVTALVAIILDTANKATED